MKRFINSIIIAILLALTGASTPGFSQVNLTRGPYLQVGTPTSIVVRWRTDAETDSRVRYGTDAQNLDQVVDVSGSTDEHAVEISGLDPQTQYFYAVGSSTDGVISDANYFFVTAPPVGTQKKSRIWILGDSGTGDQEQMDVRDAYYNFTGAVHTDLWVMVGDNAYDDGQDDEYQENLFDIYPDMLNKSVLWPAFGNHDAGSADSEDESGVFYNIFTLPRNAEAGGSASGTEAYYSFDYANIHFICLNSHDIDRSSNGEMLQWLDQDLAQNEQDWTIAYWHHPPYTKGSHDSDDEDRLIEMRENAVPILEGYGVDLVISGHSHSYERSFLLDSHYGDSGSLTNDMILDGGNGKNDDDGAYEKATLGPAPHEGAVYVVAGSSGKTSGGDLDHPAMLVSLEELGSVVLDIDADQLDLTFLDDTGDVLDYFTMVKGSGVVGISRNDDQLPQTIALHANFPNPFNPNTTIRFDLPAAANTIYDVRLEITDVTGRMVKTLVNDKFAPGSYAINWDATNQRGAPVPSGVYFYRLMANDEIQTQKMTLTR